MLRALTRVLPALGLVLALASPAGSSTVVRMTNQELAERAEHVIHGKIKTSECRRLAESGLVVTDYTVTLTEHLKGGDQKTFTFTALGGVVAGQGFAISGSPTYALNEEVVAFLDEVNARTGCRHAIGLAQGKFSVVTDDAAKDRFVERDLDGLKVVDPKGGQVLPGVKEGRRRFDPFMTEIRGFLRKR